MALEVILIFMIFILGAVLIRETREYHKVRKLVSSLDNILKTNSEIFISFNSILDTQKLREEHLETQVREIWNEQQLIRSIIDVHDRALNLDLFNRIKPE